MKSLARSAYFLALIMTAVPLVGANAPQTRSSGPLFDYCVRGTGRVETATDGLRRALDAFGAEGWEMVSASPQSMKAEDNNGDVVQIYLLFFKRPAGSGLKNCTQTIKAADAAAQSR
jgi:hypothetical protein